MPIYGDRDYLEKLRRNNVCAVCRNTLYLYTGLSDKRLYLSCTYQKHKGIARTFLGDREPNIETLREELEQTMDTKKTDALVKYAGKKELVRSEAKEILVSLFPKAPDTEIMRAVLTCVSYRLNPLNKHLFLIPFNEGKKNETWALVMGIKAKRLLAVRPVPGTKDARPFSYIDNTPRIMTSDEQMKIYGEIQAGQLMTIVLLQDPKTSAIVPGYGAWPLTKKQWSESQRKYEEVQNLPYGTEKGNTMFNMSSIRAESQAIDRLRPGEMPDGVMTVDDRVIEGEFKVVEEKQLAISEPIKRAPVTETKTQETIIDDETPTDDISWEDLKSATKPATEQAAIAGTGDEPWTYADLFKFLKRLQDKNVLSVQPRALLEKLDKDFPVELPAGTKKSLKTIYAALTKDQQLKLCMWLSDLAAMVQ
jgi:hypothetical protein